MAVEFSNLAESTLASAVSTSATSIELADASAFPSPSAGAWFGLVLIDTDTDTVEICRVTSRSGNTLAVSRGAEDTAPRAFPAGAVATAALTAEMLRDLAARGTNFADNAGTANALVARIDGVSELTDGLTVRVRASAANTTGTPSLNVSELGAVPIRGLGANGTVPPGSMVAGVTHSFTYSTADTAWVLDNPRARTADITLPTASVITRGIALNRDGVRVFDSAEDGPTDGFTTPASVAALIRSYHADEVAADLPFAWTHLGNGAGQDLVINTGQTTNMRAGEDQQYESINLRSGGILQIDGRGTQVIRVKGTFTFAGTLRFPRAANTAPLRAIGPTGKVHSGHPGGVGVLNAPPQQHPGAEATQSSEFIATDGSPVGRRVVESAILDGVELGRFAGGTGAAYAEIYTGNAGGGVLIIADKIVVASTARVEDMHASPEFSFGGGGLGHGPGGGGLLGFAAKTLERNAGARFEAGAEGNFRTADEWAAAGPEVAGAGNGQAFFLDLQLATVDMIF